MDNKDAAIGKERRPHSHAGNTSNNKHVGKNVPKYK